uniref:IRK_C domain-containing protein n=1 Tax=Angiostrongylus cantonensis TaxID=6313 RepID=A0A0K0D5Q9_ANGCA
IKEYVSFVNISIIKAGKTRKSRKFLDEIFFLPISHSQKILQKQMDRNHSFRASDRMWNVSDLLEISENQRKKHFYKALIYSEKAVICLRDGQLCFLCRVGDMRNTHLVEAHVRLQFISDRETAEGEIEPLHQFEMKVGPTITDDDRLFLVWPTTLCHVINKDSPLYEYTASSLLSAQFEIICLLEGIVESTGMTAQAKTSYLPCEILWGHRFRKLVTYKRSNGSYQVDYNLFNCTYPVKTPQCSAMEHYAQECSVSHAIIVISF